MNDNLSKVIEVDINDILPNRFQPRIQFNEEEILELSDSIKEHGIIQPIVVRTIGDKYEIIAGERRYKASVLAGKETVPVIVRNLNDKDSAEIALIENIQRKNLTPIEEALSYKKILDMGYITQEKLANKIGKSQSSVANKIRLLNLSDEVQEALLENKISERHARSLLRLKGNELQNKMLDKIINERLTVRKTDEEIDKVISNKEEDIKEEGNINMNNNINNNINNNVNMMPNMSSITPNFSTFTPQPQQMQNNPSQMENMDIFNITQQQPQEISQPQVSNFDIFATATPNSTVAPSIEMPQPAPQVESQFDLNLPTFNEPQNLNISNDMLMPNINVESNMQPEQPQVNNNLQFDANGMVVSDGLNNISQPQTNNFPQFDLNGMIVNNEVSAPTPQVNSNLQFDANGMVVSDGLNNISQPQTNNFPQFDANGMIINNEPIEQTVPFTAPIIETPIMPSNQVENPMPEINNEMMNLNIPEQPMVQPEEIKIPEPIIITDYNKQYDPIMPQSQNMMQQKVDLKEVIKLIRECSQKIEQYGYKIEVEEFDLTNSYEAVFKIEK